MKTRMLLGAARIAGAFLLGSLISADVYAAARSPLSASQQQALLYIAQSHPAAAIAMLFIDTDSSALGINGTMHLEGLPSLQGLGALLDREGDDSRDAQIVFPRSPYSTAAYFVEVRWVLSRHGNGTVRVSMRTQLVKSDGEPLRPAHALEPPVTILIKDNTFAILSRPAEGAI